MDYYELYKQSILNKYNIDDILRPQNMGDGEIKNASLSQLRKRLDDCFIMLDFPQNEYLIEHIDDFIIQLRFNITSQKNKIKRLKNNQKKKETTFEIQQERFILTYKKEQIHFLRNWVAHKSQELIQLPEKGKIDQLIYEKELTNLIEKFKNKEINPYPSIFINHRSYLLFKEFTYKTEKYLMADFSFIYRIMLKDGLILDSFRISDYLIWLEDEFEIYLDKIKTLNSSSKESRRLRYNALHKTLKPLSAT